MHVKNSFRLWINIFAAYFAAAWFVRAASLDVGKALLDRARDAVQTNRAPTQAEVDAAYKAQLQMYLTAAAGLPGEERAAWTNFINGVTTWQETGNRRKAAALFDVVANDFPKSRYAEDSRELALLLRQMVVEESRRTDPATSVERRPVEEQVAHYIHQLREVTCYQISDPGFCSVLSEFGKREDGKNAAQHLLDLGEAAVPALIGLLEDRRPIRSVGFHRSFKPQRTVLRYQDAAIEILSAQMPVAVYERSNTAAYFSNESPEVREKAIRAIKLWQERSRGKTEVQKLWLAAEFTPSAYQRCAVLEKLAREFGEKAAVLRRIVELSQKNESTELPQLTLLACELGDTRNVTAVAGTYASGGYDASDSNVRNYAVRVVILYGTAAQRTEAMWHSRSKAQPGRLEDIFFNELADLAQGRRERLPQEYNRSQFPMELLASYLDDKSLRYRSSNGTSEWEVRRCDVAAFALQAWADLPFGFELERSVADKDRIIERMMEWWKEREKAR